MYKSLIEQMFFIQKERIPIMDTLSLYLYTIRIAYCIAILLRAPSACTAQKLTSFVLIILGSVNT